MADDYKETGYNDPNEKVGLNGLEYSYQDELRGTPGLRFVERDILGTDVRVVGPVREPVPGWNLNLSIDLRLQRVMYDALKEAKESSTMEKGVPWAVAIAMNPQNGQILGMVSLPSYDNNIFAKEIGEDYLKLEKDERRPLINYAIGGLYPPGSTFKMITAAAALAEGVITPDTTVTDAGPIFLPNRYFPNDLSQAQKFVSWNHKYGIVHGAINVVKALALSNDIFFYYMGGGFPDQFVGLGQKRLTKWMELFGYGEPTGIDLPGEVAAQVPTDQWKRQLFAETWTTGDSYNMSIGQGYVLATPLQVLIETMAVANGGTIYEPRVVHHMTDANGGVQKDFAPVVTRKLAHQCGEHGLRPPGHVGSDECRLMARALRHACRVWRWPARRGRPSSASISRRSRTAAATKRTTCRPMPGLRPLPPMRILRSPSSSFCITAAKVRRRQRP